MQTIRIHKTGGPEVLTLEDAPKPTPGPGEVLLKVAAAGVNFVDIYFRKGLYNVPLPYTPGKEGAGVVERLGAGVTNVKVGERVAWAEGQGSYAEYQNVAADKLVAIPDGLDFKQAAAAMLQGMTAHYLTHSTFRIKSGDWCVVHAAAGGVGLLMCQMIKRLGGRVIGTVGAEEKAALAREAGAEAVVLYGSQDIVAEVKRLTGGKGAAVVYDSVGKDTYLKSLECLAPRGLLALFGQSSGPVPTFDPQLLSQKGSLFLTRPTMGHYTATREELLARAGAVLSSIAAGELKLRIHGEFSLSEAADAHRALEGRKTTGKVLIVP